MFSSTDNRTLNDVQGEGHSYVALLDLGVTISCLGAEAARSLMNHSNVKRCSGEIRTANKSDCSIKGRLSTNIKYPGLSKKISLYIVPEFKQDIISVSTFGKNLDY